MKRIATLVSAFLQLGIASGAMGQVSGEALTKEGNELRRDGRDAEALAVLERALAIDPSPRTRAQVGLAEQALGLWVEAERDLSVAMAASNDEWLVHHRDALQSALDAIRSRLATLSVETNVEGAQLWINGSRSGVLPLSSPLRVVAGTVTIEVRAQGYETQERSIHVAPQTRARELMTLAEAPRPQSPSAQGESRRRREQFPLFHCRQTLKAKPQAKDPPCAQGPGQPWAAPWCFWQELERPCSFATRMLPPTTTTAFAYTGH